MMPRFLVTRIDPRTGRELLGSLNNWYMEYANVQNVIKFGLRKVSIPAGQFNIYLAGINAGSYKFLTVAYKVA